MDFSVNVDWFFVIVEVALIPFQSLSYIDVPRLSGVLLIPASNGLLSDARFAFFRFLLTLSLYVYNFVSFLVSLFAYLLTCNTTPVFIKNDTITIIQAQRFSEGVFCITNSAISYKELVLGFYYIRSILFFVLYGIVLYRQSTFGIANKIKHNATRLISARVVTVLTAISVLLNIVVFAGVIHVMPLVIDLAFFLAALIFVMYRNEFNNWMDVLMSRFTLLYVMVVVWLLWFDHLIQTYVSLCGATISTNSLSSVTDFETYSQIISSPGFVHAQSAFCPSRYLNSTYVLFVSLTALRVTFYVIIPSVTCASLYL